MSRSFRTIREGREALRRARQESGMETIEEVDMEPQTQGQEDALVAATPVAPAATAAVIQPTAELEAAELALRKAKIRRENAAMVQACAMAVFAGLSALAVGIGLMQKTNKTAPAATPPGPSAK